TASATIPTRPHTRPTMTALLFSPHGLYRDRLISFAGIRQVVEDLTQSRRGPKKTPRDCPGRPSSLFASATVGEFSFLSPGERLYPGGRDRAMRRIAVLLVLLAGCEHAGQERLRQYAEVGLQSYQRGDYAAARLSFEAALSLRPDDPSLLYNVARC